MLWCLVVLVCAPQRWGLRGPAAHETAADGAREGEKCAGDPLRGTKIVSLCVLLADPQVFVLAE